MIIGSLFGVVLKVNPWFLLTLLLLSLVGLLPQALILFISVFVHELVHCMIARIHGLRTSEVELLPFGGVARIVDLGGLDPIIERNIAISGPGANLVLAACCWAVQNNWPLYPELLTIGIYGNLALAGVNLLPALPLDGGRVLRSYLVGYYGYRKATRIALILARVCALGLVGGGLLGFYLGEFNISLPVVGVFLWSAAGKEEYYSRYLFMQYITRRRAELGKYGPHPIEALLCHEGMLVKEVVRHFIPQRYHLVYLIDKEKDLLGYVTELEVIEAMFNTGIDTPLRALPFHNLGRE